MTPPKTAADYAAIAVAPLLIFLMISSLANFLVLILYHGGFSQRVSWTLLMFTLGSVGIARVAIERDRTYALGYAGILGILTFTAMLRFVDSPIFSAFILVLIGYLANVIVRDCTLIDDEIDASGQGLIDSGRLFINNKIQQDDPAATENDSNDFKRKRERQTHQPGRTVLYLALAALPLFGLGQFFLRNDPDTWARAQKLLAFYLFASLSLLVTTSFLGLRRYLRQRRVEMPRDVSIAWLAGGLALVAAVLLVAFLVPLPGKALVSFEPPAFLDSPGNTSASRYGWGQEGADKSNPDAPASTDSSPQDKEVQSLTAQEGAPAGDVGDGNRDEGPTGKQKGGDQQPTSGGDQKQSSESESPSKQENGSKQQSGQQSKPSGSDSPKQQSDQQSDPSSQESSSQDSTSDSSENQSDAQQSSESKSDSESDESQPNPDAQSDESQSNPGAQSQAGEDPSDQQDQQDPSNDQQQQSQPPDGGLPPEGSSGQGSSSSSPSVIETIADAVPMVASLFKFVVFLVLAGIVGVFVWMNRDLIAQWWDWLFGRGDSQADDSFEEFFSASTQVPPRTFASFRNPIGKESDLRRIVVITFQAFEAWTREQGIARGKDETPTEFIKRVAKSVPQMSAPASQVVDAYNRIVYGRGQATKSDLSAADQVWKAMTAH